MSWYVAFMGKMVLNLLTVFFLFVVLTCAQFASGTSDLTVRNWTRRKILEFLESNPGATVAVISKRIGKNYVTVERHVNALEKEHSLKCLKLWGRNFWFNNDKSFGILAMKLIAATSDKTRQVLLTRLYTAPETKIADLVTIAGVSVPTLSDHLQKLHEIGLVGKNRDGKTVIYFLAEELKVDSISCARLETLARGTEENTTPS